ncbi:MAG TPA: ABC-2 family transporter protein [Ilumatobacter sp.]|nr:ABC-2 family transporter protein [Ilumatobacter sp.]
MSGVRLAWLHMRVAVMNEVQYRANFFIQLVQSTVAVVTGLVALAVIFDHTTDLNGWSRPELIVVMGVYTMVGGLIGFAIEPNMGRVLSDIHQGTFDYVLTKPADSQLLSSVRQFHLWRLVDGGVGLGVIVWGLVRLEGPVAIEDVAGFVLTLVAGMILIYCLWLMITAGAFWVVRMDEVQDLFMGLYRSGQYPVTVYPIGLKLVLTYLVPIGFAVTVPAESLTGRLTWTRLAVAALFLVVVVTITRLVWRAGTRHYSGASA